MKNIFLISIFAFCFSMNTSAQDFESAIGLRLGAPLSVSYKKFIKDDMALEAYGGFRNYSSSARFLTVSGALQIHNDIASVENLQWYYGGGLGAFFWSWRNNFTPLEGDGNVSFGLQGYLGLSYTIDQVPINLSVDWVPTFFINGFGSGFGGGYGAVAIRYVLD